MTYNGYNPPKMFLTATIGGEKRMVMFNTSAELVDALRAVPEAELRAVVMELCGAVAGVAAGLISWGDFHSAADAFTTFAAALAQFEMGEGEV